MRRFLYLGAFTLWLQHCAASSSHDSDSDCGSDSDASDHSEAPTMPDHLKNAPGVYTIFWALVVVATIINYFVIINHYNKILLRGRIMRDDIHALYIPHHVMLTSRIILLPLFVTTLSLGTVFAPRQAGTWEFLKMCYEAYAFYAFYNLLIHYSGGPRALVADLSQRKHNIQIWAPTFSPCRCFILCYKLKRCDMMYNAPDEITYHNFKIAEKFVLQFCMLVPVFSVILIVVKESTLLKMATFVSTVVCMYGLFIFMNLTHDVVTERGVSTHGKFVVMKLAIVFSSLLMTILGFFLNDSYCGYDVHIITEAYGATISSFAMIPLAFMMKKNFPLEELEVCHMSPMDNPLGHPDTKTQADYEAQAASKIKGGKHAKEKRQSTIRNDVYAGSAGYGNEGDRFAVAENLTDRSRDVEADPLSEPIQLKRMSQSGAYEPSCEL